MDENASPYRKTVFVCVHQRAEGRIACANPGRPGADICEALKEAVKEAGLKKEIRVARSGCLDLCEKGPNVMIYPDGQWLSGVSISDAPAIVERLKR